jgi:hypothetical protein
MRAPADQDLIPDSRSEPDGGGQACATKEKPAARLDMSRLDVKHPIDERSSSATWGMLRSLICLKGGARQAKPTG